MMRYMQNLTTSQTRTSDDDLRKEISERVQDQSHDSQDDTDQHKAKNQIRNSLSRETPLSKAKDGGV